MLLPCSRSSRRIRTAAAETPIVRAKRGSSHLWGGSVSKVSTCIVGEGVRFDKRNILGDYVVVAGNRGGHVGDGRGMGVRTFVLSIVTSPDNQISGSEVPI